jgi:cytidylate kinase
MSSDRFATRPSGSPQGDEQRMSRSGRPGTLLITISGKSGCGNSTVSRLVAERLGLRLINFTLRDLARERGLSFEQMWERAEYDQSVDHELDRRLMELAADGECVLGTRLAIWLIEDQDLSVYLEASQQTRAARIASREAMSYRAALAATGQRDRRDRNRYLRLYDIDIDVASQADLVVDTEELDQHAVVGKIIEALRSRNLLD